MKRNHLSEEQIVDAAAASRWSENGLSPGKGAAASLPPNTDSSVNAGAIQFLTFDSI